MSEKPNNDYTIAQIKSYFRNVKSLGHATNSMSDLWATNPVDFYYMNKINKLNNCFFILLNKIIFIYYIIYKAFIRIINILFIIFNLFIILLLKS